jgi:hypothetical protein
MGSGHLDSGGAYNTKKEQYTYRNADCPVLDGEESICAVLYSIRKRVGWERQWKSMHGKVKKKGKEAPQANGAMEQRGISWTAIIIYIDGQDF